MAELPGEQLGAAVGTSIIVDRNAAGFGWFVDPTPWENEEFVTNNNDGLIAIASTAAAGQIDLLTVVLHELGHLLGQDHDHAGGLMDQSLGLGVRRFPSA